MKGTMMDGVLWSDHFLRERLPLFERVCGETDALHQVMGHAVAWAAELQQHKDVAFVQRVSGFVEDNGSDGDESRAMWAPSDCIALILRKRGSLWVCTTLMFTRVSQCAEGRAATRTAEEHLDVSCVRRLYED